MYTRPEFDPADPDAAFALIERAVFGTLVTAGPDGPVVSHPIFMLERDGGPNGVLVSHLAAANEHCDLIRQELPTVAIFMGDHGYISSSWYPRRVERENTDRDNAPTWNFATVHCHGRPEVLDVRETARHIRDCVEHLEAGRDERWHLKELGPGGMKRRLLLAKALVHRPQILVLDEPTAGVDIQLREMLWRNVRRLNDQGMTIILTTHYLEEAEEMCDRIAIIDHGGLILCEDTAALLGRADSKTLVVDTGEARALPALPEGVRAERRGDGRLALSYAPSRIPTDGLIDALRAAGLPIRDLAVEAPDLEDVFVQLTSRPAPQPG